MRFDKLLTRDKHTTRSATRIVDATLIRREHLNQHSHHSRRRIKLSPLLAFSARKLRKKVFIDSTKDVLGAIRGTAKSNIAHQVYELSQSFLIQSWTRVVFWQPRS